MISINGLTCLMLLRLRYIWLNEKPRNLSREKNIYGTAQQLWSLSLSLESGYAQSRKLGSAKDHFLDCKGLPNMHEWSACMPSVFTNWGCDVELVCNLPKVTIVWCRIPPWLLLPLFSSVFATAGVN